MVGAVLNCFRVVNDCCLSNQLLILRFRSSIIFIPQLIFLSSLHLSELSTHVLVGVVKAKMLSMSDYASSVLDNYLESIQGKPPLNNVFSLPSLFDSC